MPSTSRPGTRRRALATVGATLVVGAWLLRDHLVRLTRVNPVDFLVYRYTSQRPIGTPLYAQDLVGPMMPDGGLPFTYPPFASLVLRPTAWFGWEQAYWAWSALTIAALALVLHQVLPARWSSTAALPVGLALAGYTCIVGQHLHYGQVNLFLMALVLTDLHRSPEGPLHRLVPRGALVGIAAAIKLTPGLFIVYFLCSGQRRTATAAIAWFAVATAVGVMLRPGDSWEFLTSTLWSLDERVALDQGLGTYGNGSLKGALVALAGPLAGLATPLAVTIAAGVLVLARRFHLKGRELDAWLAIGLVAPVVSPVSWIHHWVYLVPAIATLLVRGRRRPLAWVAVAVAFAALAVGPGQGDVWLHAGGLVRPAVGFVLREQFLLLTGACLVALTRTGAATGAPDPVRARTETSPVS